MRFGPRWFRVAVGLVACAGAVIGFDRLADPGLPASGLRGTDGGLFAATARPLNRWGVRDYDYSDEKAPGIFRIVAVGGPGTFGAGVNFDDAWPKKLERHLHLYPPARPGRRFQVLNLGRDGATVPEQIGILESLTPRISPDLVILGFELDTADPAVRARFFPPGGLAPGSGDDASSLSRAFFGGTGTGRRLARMVARVRARKAREALVKWLHRPEGAGTGVIPEAFRRLGEYSRKGGLPVVVVVFPPAGVPLDLNYPFVGIHDLAARVAAENGLPVLDLLPAYRGLRERILETGPEGAPQRSDQAHRIASETLFAYLIDRRLLGPDAEPAPRYGRPVVTPYLPEPVREAKAP